MPEALRVFKLTNSLNEVKKINESIATTIKADFLKWNRASKAKKILNVWNSIPKQLGNTNMKFMYSKVRPNAKRRSFDGAIIWLTQNRLLSKIEQQNILKKNQNGFQLLPLSVIPNKIYKAATNYQYLLYMLNQILENHEANSSLFYISIRQYFIIPDNIFLVDLKKIRFKTKGKNLEIFITLNSMADNIVLPSYMISYWIRIARLHFNKPHLHK